tara:strand:+ start:79331 stop:79717 length:387 start_codon:yes stop_codon:yes gene_type:complete
MNALEKHAKKKEKEKDASATLPAEQLIGMREEMEDIWREEVEKVAVSIQKAYEIDNKSKNQLRQVAQKAMSTDPSDPKLQAIANHPNAKKMAVAAERLGRKIMSQKGGVHKQLASGYGALPPGTKGMS